MPYAVSVRQVSGLPPASFRSRLAADTLALGYVLGATPCTRDFHPLERAHAERTKKNGLIARQTVFCSGAVYKPAPSLLKKADCGGCADVKGLTLVFNRNEVTGVRNA